jgi:predicted DCC family thiol-disulfide oxidoreductase YuxK
MPDKSRITIGFCLSLGMLLGYKLLVREEPWAIGIAQVLTIALGLALLYAAALNASPIKATLRRFFSEEDSPVNLAVFRIIFFAWLFFQSKGKELIWYSGFPTELQWAPMGMGWLLPHLPINPTLALNAFVLYKFSCLLAMIGLFTRPAAVMAAVLGFYVIGVPQFYGNVAHNHHLFWFLVLFAFSRAGDALSIDAIIRGFKKADRNEDTSLPAPSRSYALPLRFMWVLMGLCYFFPGFWKVWNSGTAWVFGDNLKYHMFYDWMGFDNWLPPLRIDQHTWLCRFSGAAVILFETSYLFLIFSPKLRYIPFFGGLFFHNMTNLLMNINFYTLQFCYASFVKWDAVFKWCGRKIFSEPMTVLYDGSCSFCRRAIAFLQAFDLLGQIRYLDLHGPESQSLRDAHKLSNDALMVDMHGVVGNRIFKGFEAYRQIAVRIPLLWPLYPFLQLGFVQTIGNRVYRNVADHRACRLMPKRQTAPLAAQHSNTALIIAASILIAGNSFYGFIGKGSGWPFACYPTFSEIAWDRFRTIEAQIIYPDGTERTVRVQSLKTFTGSYRIAGLMSKIFRIKDEEKRNRKFIALWQVLCAADPQLHRAQTVRFYFLENFTDPAKRHLNPVKKDLAFEFQVNR